MKTNPAFRFLAFLICVLSASAAFWGGVLSLMYWDELWTEADYFSSERCYSSMYSMDSRVEELLELTLDARNGTLTYAQQERLDLLRRLMAPENTNYRFQLRENATGELLVSNTDDVTMNDAISSVNLRLLSSYQGRDLHEQDYISSQDVYMGDYHEYRTVETLMIWTGEEYLPFEADSTPYGYNQYGWFNDADGYYNGWNSYRADLDCRVTYTEYALTSGVLRDLPVHDEFRTGNTAYYQWSFYLPFIGILTPISALVFLLMLAYLCCSAGRQKESDEIVLTWADHIPLDVLGVLVFVVFVLGISMGDSIAYGLRQEVMLFRLAGLYVLTAALAAVGLGFVLTVAARLKARRFLSSFLCWRVCAWAWRILYRTAAALGRGIGQLARAVSMNTRLALGFLVYLGLNAFLAAGFFCSNSSAFYFIGLVAFNGGVFYLACRWVNQWKSIRQSTERIVGGDPSVQIDTHKMYGDLKEHAGQLNDLGTAINHAVDERLKSEHFKAELITNVSHDLKTPLTSIINYVDLLKKLDIDDPKAQEYLEVLDRKAQRLKKLTEDLVEASKASTGNLTVTADRMDLVEFTQQAAAEYEDRLIQRNLTLMSKMPELPLYINADGRHMWRILDNLLGNCVKYAMEGTRVYLELTEWDGKASISLKNISREALNLSPDELMERFVRGDESRTTEGSGLGLSIARSLTELQGGTFRLATDGDLFKVTVYFPVILPLEEKRG